MATCAVDLPLKKDAEVTPLTLSDADGARIYRRSLTFCWRWLSGAASRCSLTIDHSVSSGGYYCQVEGVPDFSQAALDRLDATMRDLVQQDIPFVREVVPLEDAIAL